MKILQIKQQINNDDNNAKDIMEGVRNHKTKDTNRKTHLNYK